MRSGGPNPAFQSIVMLPNRGPAASFSVAAGDSDPVIRFDGTASADPDGDVIRYDWDFGDGTSLRHGEPKPRHVYRAPGTYEARLTVTDNEGCSIARVFTGQVATCVGTPAATTTRTVVVGAKPRP